MRQFSAGNQWLSAGEKTAFRGRRSRSWRRSRGLSPALAGRITAHLAFSMISPSATASRSSTSSVKWESGR